jgi:hypothetical protein
LYWRLVVSTAGNGENEETGSGAEERSPRELRHQRGKILDLAMEVVVIVSNIRGTGESYYLEV